ncbi:MAG: hypothetical protein LIO62_04345 [Clostridiales bacterium]|nr:hypothetical protein [Clostridiales bacterium]
MKKTKKFLVLMLSVAIIVTVAVSPTISWLQSQSESVVNTFAGGKISIELDEAPVDEDGKEIDGDRVTENSYTYVAGSVLDKDPTPTILMGSDECYVFLYLENSLNDLFSLDINTTDWTLVASNGENSLYIFNSTVDASDATQDVTLTPIFEHVTVSTELTADDIEALGEKTLKVTAYAVQTEALDCQSAIDLAAEQFSFASTDITYVDINA